MHIDMPTVLLAIVVVAFSMGSAVLVSGWRLPCRFGLALWGCALLLVAAGFVLFGLFSWFHMPWLLWLGNVLLSLSFALVLLALEPFHQRRGSPWWLAGPVWLVAVLSWLFLEQPRLRVPSVDVVLLVQWLLVASSALRCQNAPLDRGRWLLLGGAGLMALIYLVRLYYLWGGREWGLEIHHQPQLPQVLTYFAGLAGLVFVTLGYVLMTREQADAEFRQHARLDALTGVPNRSAFLDTFQHVLAQAARGRWPVSLLMADIDKFKAINDTYGHLAGDAVLRAVAQRLQLSLRAQDTLGRYGGEEFLVLLPNTPMSGAATLAQHLRYSVEQLVVPWEGQNITATISIGVYGCIPQGPQDAQALIDRADQAMYAAKRAGRNRVELADALVPQPQPV